MMRRRLLLAGALAPLAPRARAQEAADWPNRPVRIIVPYAPGGILDALARLVADKLGRSLGQPFVVESRAGAGGNVGTAFVARARGDAYTLLMGNSGPLAINAALARNLPFDPLRDFIPIALVATTPLVLTVPAASPHRSVAEFIAWARAAPTPVLYGTPGVGTPQHMATEFLRLRAGFEATQVPYQGSAPVVTALLAGDVAFAIENQALVLPQIRAGSLRALAVTTPQRSAELAEVPTLEQAGMEGYQVRGWYGLLAPAGVPPAIIPRLNAAVREAVRSPDVAERLASFGSPYVAGTPEEFGALIAADIERWREVARVANITLE
jgi:tripartite-type tricarboxylate transporter receptor subunit TctC